MCGIERQEEKGAMVEVYDIETSKLVEVYEVRGDRPSNKDVYGSKAEGIPSKRELVAELASRQAQIGRADKSASALSLFTGHRLHSLTPSEEDGSLLLPSSTKSTSGSSGYLLVAGEDRCVRYFDLPGDGLVICGSPKQKDVLFRSTDIGGIGVHCTVPRTGSTGDKQKMDSVRETMGRQPLRPHYDAVCAMGVVETGVSSCVISGDRSGVVKVWRVEGAK